MDLGSRIAETTAGISFEDLPDEAVLAAKMAILDTLGVMLAGSGVGEGVEKAVSLVESLDSHGGCSILGFDVKSNPVFAALANGALAHSIDYDDAHDDAFVHPSASVVPAALVAGEYAKASGKDLITAVALGDDVICRLGFSVSDPAENAGDLWMLPVLMGSFSATVAAAKILRLDAAAMENALGIAFNRAGGSKELVLEPGSLRGLYAMFPNMTGMLSALLAAQGVEGLKNTFDGPAGFFKMYYDGVIDECAFDDFGERFEGANVSIKPWPCCRFTNSHVDAALGIARDEDLNPEEIVKITLFYAEENTKRCLEPLEMRRHPKTMPEAKISLPFTVAQALAYRKLEIGDFSADALVDPVLCGLCDKTFSEYDETLANAVSKTMLPGRVRVEMSDGRIFDRRVDAVYGHPKNRMKWEDLEKKFRDCASYCRKHLDEVRIEALVDMVEHLESVTDVSVIAEMVR